MTGAESKSIRGDFVKALCRAIVHVDETPVVTRFWTFGVCLRVLLRMFLLGIDASFLDLRSTNPNQENGLRLGGFKTWLTDPTTGGSIRVACLCLQLTEYATNLSAQKQDDFLKRGQVEPTLVRLGQGVVQERTSLRLSELLKNLDGDSELPVLTALESLLLTEMHLVARFNSFYSYPTALWRLSRRFNPTEYTTACTRFLKVKPELLDVGFSLRLQRRARKAGAMPGSQCEYLFSKEVQGDIDALFSEAAATSLDVERKHFQDKKAEGYKLMSLATASRNAILRRYRQARQAEIGRIIRLRKDTIKHKFMNKTALVMMRHPEWFKRARGSRFGESNTTKEQRSSIVFEGNKERFDRYLEDNAGELEATAAKMREHARAVERSILADAEVPLRNLQWLRWLDNHPQAWGEAMMQAAKDKKLVSARIVGTNADYPDCERLQPTWWAASLDADGPRWLRDMLHQPPGFYTILRSPAQPLVIFACTCQGIVYALELDMISNRFFRINADTRFDRAMRPLAGLAKVQAIPGEATIHCVTIMEHRPTDSEFLRLYVDSIKQVVRRTRAPPSKASSAGEHAAPAVAKILRDPDSDSEATFGSDSEVAEQLWTDVESDAEKEAEEQDAAKAAKADAEVPEPPSDDEERHPEEVEPDPDLKEPRAIRRGAGTHVIDGDAYFSYINNMDFPNVKVLIAPSWCRPHLMGDLKMAAVSKTAPKQSKTITIRYFDPSRSNPVLSLLLCRAWAVWRISQYGFCEKHKSRSYHRQSMLRRLEHDVRAYGIEDGSTGVEMADRLFRQWAPSVLTGGGGGGSGGGSSSSA